MTAKLRAFFYWLGFPFRALADGFRVLVNLTRQQMRALFSVAMIGGIISLSTQNFAYVAIAGQVVARGENYAPMFRLVQEQMRFNSALIGWFAVILGLVVFGADYFRAKLGEKELEFGSGTPPERTDNHDPVAGFDAGVKI